VIRRRHARGVACLTAAGVAVLCAACGSTRAPASARATVPAAAPAQSLAYSEATSEATWAALPMGATSGPNEFWQLFMLPAGSHTWRLDTPPDIATNGAIELGGLSGTSLVVGIRPSLYLGYSPVSVTANAGATWTAGPPAQGLASVPDALAATAGGGHILALTTTAQVSTAAATATTWTKLATEASLAATSAGRACGVDQLTAVAYSPASVPLVAASCGKPGQAGIFTLAGATWRSDGPALPAQLAGSTVAVVRLVTSADQTTALLLATDGTRRELLAASVGRAGKWTTSAPLNLGASSIRTTSFSAAGAIALLLSNGRAEILAGDTGTWELTDPVPAGTSATIALPGGGQAEALTASGSLLTVWQLTAGGQWAKTQTIKVPIQYGSSS